MRGTRLEEMYKKGEYTPPTLSEYVEQAVYILTHIHPGAIVHRLTGDCPQGMLVAPEWNSQKHTVINAIVGKMQFESLTQGCHYIKK